MLNPVPRDQRRGYTIDDATSAEWVHAERHPSPVAGCYYCATPGYAAEHPGHDQLDDRCPRCYVDVNRAAHHEANTQRHMTARLRRLNDWLGRHGYPAVLPRVA